MLCTSKYCSSLAIGLSLIFGVLLFIFIAIAVVRISVVSKKEVIDEKEVLTQELAEAQIEIISLKSQLADAITTKVEEDSFQESVSVTSDIKTGSEITEVDDTWNLYTNYDHGFSLKVPKKIQIAGPSQGFSNVVVHEESDKVYITSEEYYNGSEIVSLSLDDYKKYQDVTLGVYIRGWVLNVWDVQDDVDLLAQAQEEMSTTTCLLTKTLVDGTNWYSVKLSAENSNEYDEGCFINGNYGLFYNVNDASAVYWGIGQAYSFFRDQEFYDMDMKESFQFLGQ